jgi:GNAT superfamily N-acetyltransferase
MNMSASDSTLIRPAHVEEATLLTNLAIRAKAYWGSSAEFMAAARAEMTVTATQLETQCAFVLEQAGEVKGFYKLLEVTPSRVELTDLFMEPSVIGHGWGRVLWEHAVLTAQGMGYAQMTFESDPNAEGFYLHMGAQRVGTVESSVKPGRMLPRMLYVLRQIA